jgi:hypothetical protein
MTVAQILIIFNISESTRYVKGPCFSSIKPSFNQSCQSTI